MNPAPMQKMPAVQTLCRRRVVSIHPWAHNGALDLQTYLTTSGMKLTTVIYLSCGVASAWMPNRPMRFGGPSTRSCTALDMAAVGIFFGTSTGNTETCADTIYEAFGSELASEPVDIDTLDEAQVAAAFAEHDALVIGTPTWNTGADTERSGTGWDALYYGALPNIASTLQGKNVAVFGLGDQISYAENYADATGELFDVFEGLGCKMMGSWSQDGYEHEGSKSIRGDKFCGLLLDMINQEELTEERVEEWVAQLKSEGFLDGAGSSVTSSPVVAATAPKVNVNGDVSHPEPLSMLDENSSLLDQNIAVHSSGGYTPHHNSVTGKTMWTSADGRTAFVTSETATQTTLKP